ncbi:thioredoxin [Faecalibaculum rodentium]|uniref:thioredoxin n=1 Tax=Faecalibaculum rodentium TaxID=1702221 RepID=UPI001F56AF37|nr:thioredoxin [Faecalibaculum rodentium]
MIKQVESVESFKKIVEEPAVLMDFFATWCGPCKMLHPVLESVSEKVEGVTVAQCDIDKFPEIAAAFKVQSVPTLFFFKNGTPVAATAGFQPEPQLMQFIQQAQVK